MSRYIPFKFKLTLIISVILVILLGVTYQFIRIELESQFVARIKSDLATTQSMVQTLFSESFRKLTNSSRAISGHVFVKEILTDETMDQATRDDLINDEILHYFRDTVDLIIVATGDGNVLASTRVGKTIQAGIKQARIFQDCVEFGESGALFLFQDDRYYQVVIEPFFLEEQMIGVIGVGIEITQAELARIKNISSVDLAFLQNGRIFLSTKWEDDAPVHQSLITAFDAAVSDTTDFSEISASTSSEIRELQLMRERFLYFLSPFRLASLPDEDSESTIIATHLAGANTEVATIFVLIKSLDRELLFLRKLLKSVIAVGIVGIVLAIITGYLFSRHITWPITTLRRAAKEVENGNLNHRVEIKSHDEFSELGNSFNDMIVGLAEKERVRGAMNKVVSRKIADEMLKGDIQLGGEEKHATILFVDIREFTALSEGLSATILLQTLNRLFTRMSACIDKHNGVIDKYIGDSMMALFGVPTGHTDDSLQAVTAAQDILEELDQYNNDIIKDGGQPIKIGIGINTGDLVAGNMGAENRLNYTVLGDEVNLASRLEGLCKVYGATIIISEATRDELNRCTNAGHQIPTRLLDCVCVKGKSAGIKVYEVFGKEVVHQDVSRRISMFGDARDLMLRRNFFDAIELLNELLQASPDDQAGLRLRNRCQHYQAAPNEFEDDYKDGIFIATGK